MLRTVMSLLDALQDASLAKSIRWVEHVVLVAAERRGELERLRDDLAALAEYGETRPESRVARARAEERALIAQAMLHCHH